MWHTEQIAKALKRHRYFASRGFGNRAEYECWLINLKFYLICVNVTNVIILVCVADVWNDKKKHKSILFFLWQNFST